MTMTSNKMLLVTYNGILVIKKDFQLPLKSVKDFQLEKINGKRSMDYCIIRIGFCIETNKDH